MMTTDVGQLLATPDLFAAWLATKASEAAIAGVCGDPASCPLHEFIVASGFDGWCSVGRVDVELTLFGSTKLHKVGLPEWAREFIRAVDLWKPMQRLLAEEALVVLDTLLEEFPRYRHA